ncbi:hypothetical protein RIF29_11626 [Crotalaria pallida]|uniref:Uncharacterized protein n=1 Tax=Crotalaria pallida TaxID=3830 RepID=A0AAN9IMD1_CROPI
MVTGKNSRGEGRKSSRYCSTFSLAVLVAFCFVGLWIAMSSIVQMQNLLNSVILLSDPIYKGKHIVSESSSREIKDRLGIENVSDNTAEENQQAVVWDSLGERHELEKSSTNTMEESYQMRLVKQSIEEKEADRNFNLEFVESEKLGAQVNDDELRSAETLDERKSVMSIKDNKLGTEKSRGEITQQDEMDGETEEDKIKKNLP